MTSNRGSNRRGRRQSPPVCRSPKVEPPSTGNCRLIFEPKEGQGGQQVDYEFGPGSNVDPDLAPINWSLRTDNMDILLETGVVPNNLDERVIRFSEETIGTFLQEVTFSSANGFHCIAHGFFTTEPLGMP